MADAATNNPNGQENLLTTTAMSTATVALGRLARILFFTEGAVPNDDEAKEFEGLRNQYGPNVVLRNAALVSDLPFSSLEDCDAVAGKVPARYGRTYPALGDLSDDVINRASDYDLPHARKTGSLLDPGNEAARAARPPSIEENGGRGNGYSTAPRVSGLVTARDGGTVISTVGAATLSGFGDERAENAYGAPSAAATEGGPQATAAGVALTTGKAPADATPPTVLPDPVTNGTKPNPAAAAASGFGAAPAAAKPAEPDKAKAAGGKGK